MAATLPDPLGKVPCGFIHRPVLSPKLPHWQLFVTFVRRHCSYCCLSTLTVFHRGHNEITNHMKTRRKICWRCFTAYFAHSCFSSLKKTTYRMVTAESSLTCHSVKCGFSFKWQVSCKLFTSLADIWRAKWWLPKKVTNKEKIPVSYPCSLMLQKILTPVMIRTFHIIYGQK